MLDNEARKKIYETSDFERSRFELVRSEIARQFKSGDRILEIGAGLGHFTNMLLDVGTEPTLVEPDESRAHHLRLTFENLKIVRDVFPTEQLSGEHFDGALVLEVIEHVKDPQSFLASLAQSLKPGARVILSTPNRLSMESQVHLLKFWLGGRVFNAGDATHLWLFSPGEITRMLRHAGFQPTSVKSMHFGCGDQRGGKIPLLPFYFSQTASAKTWPFNRLGFNLMVSAIKK